MKGKMSTEPRVTASETDAACYTHWTEVNLRYGDTDRQGHINNAVFTTLLESGRVAFLFNEKGEVVAGNGKAYVIAKLTMDFLAEMNFPGSVRIGTKVLTTGRSSFTLGQAIFLNGKCCSTAQSVIVLTDEQTRRSTPLTESLLEQLSRYS
jgi:acyl-CoA thioester hydrolase